jgi:hypothetical protein
MNGGKMLERTVNKEGEGRQMLPNSGSLHENGASRPTVTY